jgi:hypothetical protein
MSNTSKIFKKAGKKTKGDKTMPKKPAQPAQECGEYLWLRNPHPASKRIS